MHHRQMGMLSYTFLGQTIFIKIFEVHLHKNYNEKINKQYYHYTIAYNTGLEGDASFFKEAI
jgi:hypothetical protein